MHSCTISKTTSLVTTFRVFTNQLASRTSPTRIFVPPRHPLSSKGASKNVVVPGSTFQWLTRKVGVLLFWSTTPCHAWRANDRARPGWVQKHLMSQIFSSFWGRKTHCLFLCGHVEDFCCSANYQFSCNLLTTKNKAHQIVGCTLSMYINSTKSHIPSQEFANGGQNDLPSEKCWNSTLPPSVPACSEPPRQGEIENFRNVESQESWEMPSIFTFDNNSTLILPESCWNKKSPPFFLNFCCSSSTNQSTHLGLKAVKLWILRQSLITIFLPQDMFVKYYANLNRKYLIASTCIYTYYIYSSVML